MRIRKKNGNTRLIHNPSKLARIVQYRLLTKYLNEFELPDYVCAFEIGKTIPDMASNHIKKAVVISIDIKDFFPSIKQALVERVARECLNLPESAARVFSEVTTFKYYVPQGALTSPKIANIITATTFGPILKEYCDANGLTMTIYADDVTISGPSETNVKEVISKVGTTLGLFGFRVNKDKTKVMKRGVRQYVCGAVVNDKVNLPKVERRKLRAIVHNICTNGLEAEASKTDQHPSAFLSHIQGRLNWFKQLNPQGADPLISKLKTYVEENPPPTITMSEVSNSEQATVSEPGTAPF